MSYKPTNEDLIAYLYGELDESSKAQIDRYLEENPEARVSLEAMEETRVVFSHLEDEEVPAIPGFIEPRQNSEWLYWRKYVGIAATLLLLMTFGWAAGFNLSYGEGGFYIGFGQPAESLSIEDVNRLVAEREQDLIFKINSGMLDLKDSVDQEIKLIQANLSSQNGFGNDAQINELIDEQRREVVAEMSKLSEKMTEDYREVLRQMIVSFSDNIDTRRIQDIGRIQTALTDLEDALLSKQEAMEEALYNLSIEVDGLARNED